MIHKFIITLAFLTASLSGAQVTHADMLADFTQKAILKNPDVLSRWHTFNASTEEIQGARGGYFPRVDVTANTGKETKGGVSATTPPTFNRSSTRLELTQMLWDGFSTRDEIRRLNHAQLSRHYELLDATENVALEVVRSYNDVLRNRELYALTEDNYVYHRTVFEQIQNKVKAGVGRKVDLEQISGRVALSESNLVNDKANVHDVGARFQRVVGEIPPKELAPPPSMASLVPLNAYDAHLALGLEANPAILAAIENIRSAQSDLDKGKGKYQPRLDLHLSESKDRNSGGITGQSSDKVAEVTLTWNLFSGGADVSRTKQNFEHIDVAKGQRDSACRNVRQTLEIAYNDVWKLSEQMRFLEQHQLSIEKARTAYQKQFDIGQRTLLDLLDTENELYQARRAYINGRYDLNIAYARTLAGMGKLVSSMGLTHLEAPDLPSASGYGSDAPENCPAEGPIVIAVDKEELNLRAAEKAKEAIEAAAAIEKRKAAEAAQADADAAEAAKFAAEAAKIESEFAKPGGKATKPAEPQLPARKGAKPPEPAKPSGAAAPKPSSETSTFAAEAAAAAKFAGAAPKPADEASKLAAEATAAAKFAGAAAPKPLSEASTFAAEAAAAAKFAGAAPKPADEASKLAAEAAAAAKFAGAAPAGESAKVAAQAAAAPATAGTPTPPEAMLERWLKDWESKNVDAYLAHYDVSFLPGSGKTRQDWEAERRRRIAEAASIKLRMENLEITQQSPIKVTAVFTEILEINGKKKTTEKQLELIRDGKEWYIQEEKALPKRSPRSAVPKAAPTAKSGTEDAKISAEAAKAEEAIKAAEQARAAAKVIEEAKAVAETKVKAVTEDEAMAVAEKDAEVAQTSEPAKTTAIPGGPLTPIEAPQPPARP
jgi:adhesin transport system outer membrane protein